MNRALVVDDSNTDLARIRGILGDAGCLVITASNGVEAVAKAKAEKPGIIFLDIIMPDMDGYQACRLLSQDPETRDIPVIFVSTKGGKTDRAWGQMQGAKGYVTKPYTPDEILGHLEKAA